MESVLQIDKMNVSEKLQAMKLMWDDLCRTPGQISSPDWHEEILNSREERIKHGKAQMTDWPEIKDKIRTSVK